MYLTKPLRTLLARPAAAQVLPITSSRQYAISMSDDLCTLLTTGVWDALEARLVHSTMLLPALIEDEGIEAYEQSVRRRTLFRYQRAEYFTTAELLTTLSFLRSGGGNVVGTRAELGCLSAWIEHQQDYLSLAPGRFDGYRGLAGCRIHYNTIDAWFSEAILAIDALETFIKPIRLLAIPAWLCKQPGSTLMCDLS